MKIRAAAGVILAALIAVPVTAETDGASRTHAGEKSRVPDFSGLWARAGDITFFPVPGSTDGAPIERLNVDHVDAEEIIAGNYDNPILLPWTREIVKRNAESEIALNHIYDADDACWPSGVPQILNRREPVQFLQREDRVVILYQRDHQVRWVWLNQKHDENAKPSWYGESTGHYEGDTLVVDTVRLKTHKMSFVDNYGTPHTDRLHVEERYRVIEDDQGKGLEVTFRVTDPGAFTMPWSGRVVYRPSRFDFLELACAENNRHFGDGETFGEIPQAKTSPF